jgi:phage shock protein C
MNNRKLYRSNTDKMIAGVCAGLAEYINIDPTVVRLVFVILILLGGNGLLLYFILWILMPQEPVTIPANNVTPTPPAV